MPAAKPSASRHRFTLNAESIAALRAAFASDPAKLRRLEERLLDDAKQAARRTALESKIALLKSRNAALRAAAQPRPLITELGGSSDDESSGQSSTSAGTTLSPFASTVGHAAASSVPTRGPSPALLEKQSVQTAAVTVTSKAVTTLSAPTAPAPAPAPAPPAPAAAASPSPTVDEFDEKTMRTDTAPVPDTWGSAKSVFRYAGPSVKGMVSSVVKEGVLYRIITDKGEWAFYADTRDYTAQVRYRLLGGSAVTPGPAVKVTPAGPDQELCMEVGPEETKVLLKGRVIDFENLSSVTLHTRKAATSATETALCREPLMDWKVIAASYPKAKTATTTTTTNAVSSGAASKKKTGTPVLDRTQVTAEAVLAHCMAQHIRFVDPAFFPSHASLSRPTVDDYFVAPLHWRSPFAYLPDEEKVRREVRLFRGPVLLPDTLRPGPRFPDTTFLSCVVAMAARCSGQLRALFLHPSGAVEGRRERAVGAYRVQLCLGGWWESVVVDGFVPAAATCPEFSHSSDDLRVLWLPLLQKACAKMWGSYAASLNAPMESLIGLFTGGPCCTLREMWPSRDDLRTNTQKATRFFATLKKVLRMPSLSSPGGAGPGYLCWLRPYSLTTARTRATKDKLEKLYGDVGLAPGTAAVVLGIENLANGHCVVQLRQTAEPRRSSEMWLGVWRAARKPWVDELSDFTFALGGGDGTVWMGLEDVPQYFQSGYLAPLTGDWAAVKAKGVFARRRPSLALQVEVSGPTRAVVTVTQADMDAHGKRRPPSIASTPTAGTPMRENGEAGRTDGTLVGLSCLAFGSAATANATNLRFLGASSDSADVFNLATTPCHTYERDVSVGLLLDPSNGPFVFVPSAHTLAVDVAYTMTVQAVGVVPPAANRVGKASSAATLTVRFLEVSEDGVPIQAGAQPVLRAASLVPRSTPLMHQARPLGSRRVVSGEGCSVTLPL